MYKIIVMDNFVDALEKLPLENIEEIKDSFLSISKLSWEEISNSINKNSKEKDLIKI